MHKLTEFGDSQRKMIIAITLLLLLKIKAQLKHSVIIIQLILIIYFVRMNLIYLAQKVR